MLSNPERSCSVTESVDSGCKQRLRITEHPSLSNQCDYTGKAGCEPRSPALALETLTTRQRRAVALGSKICTSKPRRKMLQYPMRRPPRWPSGKASVSRAEDPRFESRLSRDFFRGRVIPVTQKLALQWLPCQAPGVIGSALGLVGPVSVYCDWVR